jgi:uncharacterized membrane protein (DUF2068 family)
VARPVTLRACVGLLGAEAAGLAAAAVFFFVELAVADADDRVRAAVAGVLVLAAAVGLALVTRGLWQRRRWARAPALVSNLLVLPVAFDLVRGGRWYVGGPLLLVALAVLALLFAPATDAALED